jgi:hypothetical protein
MHFVDQCFKIKALIACQRGEMGDDVTWKLGKRLLEGFEASGVW